MVKDVRPDIVPNCPPERNLFLEALGLESTTKSTNLTGSKTASTQPQRSQPARVTRSAPGASQPLVSTQVSLFPYGQKARSKSTRGSARKATKDKAEEAPSPESLKSTQPESDTGSKSPESTSDGQVNQQQGEPTQEMGRQALESDLLQEWGDAFDNGHIKADFDVWAEERKRDIRVLSKWGKEFFSAKKPTTRVTMSKGKEVIEPILDPAVGASQHSINHPLSETTTIINAEGKILVCPKEEEGVDYNPSSDEDGTEGKPHDLADSPLEELMEAPSANTEETSEGGAEIQESPATEVPVQPATSTAVALHQPGSHAVSNQP